MRKASDLQILDEINASGKIENSYKVKTLPNPTFYDSFETTHFRKIKDQNNSIIFLNGRDKSFLCCFLFAADTADGQLALIDR